MRRTALPALGFVTSALLAATADTTEVYGVGALLLAGSEVYRLAGTGAPR